MITQLRITFLILVFVAGLWSINAYARTEVAYPVTEESVEGLVGKDWVISNRQFIKKKTEEGGSPGRAPSSVGKAGKLTKKDSKKSHSKINGQIKLSLSLSSLRAKRTDISNGTQATAISSGSPGLMFNWRLDWGNSLKTDLFLGRQTFNFEISSNRTLLGGRQSHTYFGLEATYFLSDVFYTGVEGGRNTHYLLSAQSSSELSIESVHAYYAKLHGGLVLFNRGGLKARLNISYGLAKPQNLELQQLETSSFYGTGLHFGHSFGQFELSGEFNYQQLELASTGGNQQNRSLDIMIGLGYRY